MATWLEDVEKALENIGGTGKLSDIYQEVRNIRPKPHIASFEDTIRGCLERHSSDSQAFEGNDVFFSVEGIGFGVWGLRSIINTSLIASDIEEINDDNPNDETPHRIQQETYRILRDTYLARKIKSIHNNYCQICSQTIKRNENENYSEAHHIMPLGRPHNGPDIAENIIILCPNHHVMLDYGIIKLDESSITQKFGHLISKKYLEYHNNKIFQGK